MKSSTRLWAMSSWIWIGGLFMKYELGATSVPARPRSSPSLAQRMASVMTPALFGRVPDLELELEVERHVSVGRALHADVAPLAVLQPRHVVGRADVNVLVVDLVVDHRGDRVRLADLLRLEPLALQHVEEVGVAAEVQLVGAVDPDAAVHEQAGQHAMRDRGADLALDVVADDRQPGLGESALPVGLAADEDRDGVDEGDARLDRLLDVPLRGLLAADRQVARPARRPCAPSGCRRRRRSGRAPAR